MSSKKNILLGVSGGIAAYKAAEICRLFVKSGYSVKVVMTENAKRFVSPLTFQTLSENKVYDELFAAPENWEVQHIGLASETDLCIVAPATANLIAKVANGMADDMLTTTITALKCPVLLAPAMNNNMFENQIIQDNIAKLKRYGYSIIEPEIGELACGTTGRGRMSEPGTIYSHACQLIEQKKDLSGLTVLITAGPTREAIDPIRFISNHSSGKMGYALAKAAADRGARVLLISGPTVLKPPPNVKLFSVEKALDMYKTVKDLYEESDIVIKSAAVADYRPTNVAEHKIKKGGNMVIELERNPDILAELGENKKGKVLIGFAAETQNLLDNARQKIDRKNLDMIVANNVKETGVGFASDYNKVKFIYPDGKIEELDTIKKELISHIILDRAMTIQKKG